MILKQASMPIGGLINDFENDSVTNRSNGWWTEEK